MSARPANPSKSWILKRAAAYAISSKSASLLSTIHASSGPLATFWRYRVGDYRIICDMQDHRLVVLVVEIGHRRDVYR
jgi:mRNA-degrading endonuclease RelE of RelBE toxin-antitoxin system